MALTKTTVARLLASWHEWSAKEFVKHVEKGQVYEPEKGVYCIIVGRDDKDLPFDQLAKAYYLVMAIPYDAVNAKTLSVLWAVEVTRLSEGIKGFLRIEVVGDTGRDAATKEIKYSSVSFLSTISLLWEIQLKLKNYRRQRLEKLRQRYAGKPVPGSLTRLCNACVKAMLKETLKKGKGR